MRNIVIYTVLSLLLGLGALTFGLRSQFKDEEDGGGSHQVGAKPSIRFAMPAGAPDADQRRLLEETAASYEVRIVSVEQTPSATQLTLEWTGCGDYLGRDFIDGLGNRGLISTFQAMDVQTSRTPDGPTTYAAVYWVRFKRK